MKCWVPCLKRTGCVEISISIRQHRGSVAYLRWNRRMSILPHLQPTRRTRRLVGNGTCSTSVLTVQATDQIRLESQIIRSKAEMQHEIDDDGTTSDVVPCRTMGTIVRCVSTLEVAGRVEVGQDTRIIHGEQVDSVRVAMPQAVQPVIQPSDDRT